MSERDPVIPKESNYVYEKPKPITLFASVNDEVRRNAEVTV